MTMGLALGLMLSSVAQFDSGSTPVFDPATLSLTGWWRASYAGSPWAGETSAGTSDTRSLTEATNPPSVGAAINGLTPADFDGTNDILRVSDGGGTVTLAGLFSATAGSIALLLNADAASADAGAASGWDIPGLLVDDGSFFYLAYSTSGVRGGFHDGVSHNSAVVACATGSLHLAQMRWDASSVEVRIDSGSWTSVSRAGGISNISGAVRIGENWNAGKSFNGVIAEVLTTNSKLADADFDDILSYVNDRYGLAL